MRPPAQVISRFGMFGIRMSVALLSAGSRTPRVLPMSYWTAVVWWRCRSHRPNFGQRSELLKAHTALLSLRQFVATNRIAAAARIIADIDPRCSRTPCLRGTATSQSLHSRSTTFTDERDGFRSSDNRWTRHRRGEQVGSDRRDPPTTGHGHSPRRSAGAGARTTLNDPFTTRACRGAQRRRVGRGYARKY